MEIICRKHGSFWQTPNAHLNGRKCPKCAHKSRAYSKDEICELFNKTHLGKYKYDLSSYVNGKSRISVLCPIHGWFQQIARDHLRGNGCQKCAETLEASETDMYEMLQASNPSLKIIRHATGIAVNTTTGYSFEADIYVPSKQVIIELNGEYWHAKREKQQPGYHKEKHAAYKKAGVRIINVAFRYWKRDKVSVLKKLNDALRQ